jgi:NADPH-dependent ferric siderophore reductase
VTGAVLATIVATAQVTPLTRRLVFGGAGIAALRPPADALGPYLKFRLPLADGRRCIRTYSVRRFDPARNELSVDMVLHAGEAVGSRFGASAAVGVRVEIGGPGFIPAEPCRTFLLAGDHTALPAIANILETLPASAQVEAFVEVPDIGEEQAMPSRAQARITWLHRPAGAASRLADALRAAWPSGHGDLLVWAGAEAAIARAIRRHARDVRGIAPARCQVLNYWKRGQPEGGFSYVA